MTLKRMLARAGALAFLLMVFAMHVFAQSRTVTGKVTDSKDGSPIANASVTIKGTNLGTTTDANGSFRLAVPDNNAVLVISSVGFSETEVAVGAQSDLSVTMISTQGTLNEVVVVGYGTQRKRDLSGAVATVSSKDFVKGALQTPEQLIAGKVAGVQITPNSGAPGSGSRIRIRGGASLNASNDPLIVIDGVPVDNGGISGATNPLNLINPNDIETFTILKDPSAAAIYGSRASNGVILITTKKGKKGKTRFNFSAQGFVQTPSGKVDVLSADDVRSIVTAKGTPAQVALLGKESTDWQDQVFRNAFAQDFNLSATGAFGDGKFPFRISGGYLNQDGILKTGNFQRLTGAINLSPSFFNNKLKVDLNLKGARTTNAFANEGAIGNAVTFDPTKPIRSGSQRYGGYWEWTDPDGLPTQLSNRNPVGLLNDRTNTSEVYRSIGNIQFDYQLPFLKGLRANLNLGYDVSQGSGLNTTSDSAASSYRRQGNFSPYFQQRTNKLMDFYLNYVRSFGDNINSRVDFTAGTGYQDFEFYSFNHPDRRFNGDLVPGSEPEFLSQAPGYTMISYYGRLVYTLADKYTVTLNARTDGTSKFSKESRWGFFPSAAVAWQISEENFLKNSKVVSNLKLRAGYGVTGQQDGIPFYGYIPVYSISNDQAQYQLGNSFVNMLRPGAYDADLRWETTTNINAAIDFGFIDNRINGTLEGFIRKTEDLLSTVPIPAGSNFTNQLFTNVGNIESKGLEITINTVPVRTKNVEWDVGVNFTYVVPEITNLLVNEDPNFTGVAVGGISGGTGNTIQRHIVGQRPASFYVYKQIYDGNNKPIEGLYEDLNRDGIINEKDLYIYQSPEARYFLGVTSNVTLNRFSAGFVMRGSIGNYMYDNVNSNNGVYRQLVNPLGFLANGTKDYLHTGFFNNQYFSDYYMKNASFLRMDNINFGYDAGEVMKNVRLRITANIQNAFVITKYGGLDPEISGGIDNTIYPRPRTYVLGFNFDF